MIRSIASLIIGLNLMACRVEVTTQNPDKDPSESENQGSSDGNLGSDEVASEAKITALVYNRETHSLVATISYGGCRAAKHKLVFDACAESYPAQCSALLVHEKDFDSKCDMAVTEDFVYKLESNFDAAYVTVRNKNNEKKTALVDKTGNVAKGVTPPNDAAASTEQSAATIKTLAYDKAQHALTMTLEYSGCANAKHDLIFSDVCLTSFPTQCSAVLVREKGYDASCKKLISEAFTYKLQESTDTTVLTINAQASSKSVLIDRLDQTKQIPPAP